jgi:hypothetical protein
VDDTTGGPVDTIEAQQGQLRPESEYETNVHRLDGEGRTP